MKIPGTIGETVILPKVRYAYGRLPFADWRSKRYAASEARRIQSAISTKRDQFTIVFDAEIIGLTYGALLYMLPVARYIISKHCFVRFCIINTDYPNLDGGSNQQEVEDFINNIVDISNVLLDPEWSSVCQIPNSDLSDFLDSTHDDFLLFREFTRERRQTYWDCFNVFNNLMAHATDEERDRVLFSVDDFQEYFPNSFSRIPYLSWSCRYSAKGGQLGRQTLPNEFQESYNYLRNRFPNHKILIVSDLEGCQHYSSLATELQIDDLLFSKDFSPDLLGDFALVMGSDFFFWYRAGGIGIVPLISTMPFEMIGPLKHEIRWDKRNLTSWQQESQTFIVVEKHETVDDRSADLDRIGSFSEHNWYLSIAKRKMW